MRTFVVCGLMCALLAPDPASAQDGGAGSSVGVAAQAETTPEGAARAGSTAAATVSIDVSAPMAVHEENVELEVSIEEESEVDGPQREELPPAPQAIFLHGFRFGYLYVFDTEGPLDPTDATSPQYAARYGMRSPHLFMMGYEATWRMVGYDWLNLILTGNIMFAGFEQSRVFPSVNLLVGAEIASMAQIGLGVSVTPTKEEPVHMIVAAGWTPRIGSFYVPLHVFFVPDISGHHKFGVTVGVNFF